jgi:hypothetical protein
MLRPLRKLMLNADGYRRLKSPRPRRLLFKGQDVANA